MISRRQEIFCTIDYNFFLIPQISHNRGSLCRQFFSDAPLRQTIYFINFSHADNFFPVTIPDHCQSLINTLFSRHDQVRSKIIQSFCHSFGWKTTVWSVLFSVKISTANISKRTPRCMIKIFRGGGRGGGWGGG